MNNPPFAKNAFKIKTNYSLYHNKLHIIQLFNIVALLFVMPLMINAFLKLEYKIAFVLLVVGVTILGNYFYLKKTANEVFGSHFLSFMIFGLMAYLLYTGGISNTGPLWIASLPLIVFFALGFKKGFIYILLFLLFAVIILYIPADLPYQAQYSDDFKLRIVLSFLLITFLSGLYERNNTISFITMQKLREELEDNSTRDYLTSLYNRRGYRQYIQNMQNPKGVVLMCDMDYFKNINDTYGHDAGDFVLQEVATKIQNIIRKTDIAIRWGGEEFFVFLPNTTIIDGALIAEEIRMGIEKLSLIYKNHTIETSLSIGAEEITKTMSLTEAISHADHAMYQAKKSGRNRTVVYTSP